VLLQPVVAVEEEELLAPQHPCESLAHHPGFVRGDGGRGHRAVELVGLLEPYREGLVELRAEVGRCRGLGVQPQPDRDRLTGGDRRSGSAPKPWCPACWD